MHQNKRSTRHNKDPTCATTKTQQGQKKKKKQTKKTPNLWSSRWFYWCKDRHRDLWNRIESSDKNPYIYGQLVLFSEKAMASHFSTLAWKIPWTEEPCRLQSMGSLRVGHDWATSLSLSCIGEGNGNPLVFLPGESQGWGSLVGCHLWGRTESDTTKAT